jgi:ketosteroid isomerase-like protein
MASDNAELTRAAFAAMNRGDVEWLIEHSEPDIEMHMRGVAGEPVRYTGASGIREYFRDMAEIWDSVTYVADEIRDLGDRVFAVVTHRLRGRSSGIEVDGTYGIVFEVGDGKVTELRAYSKLDEARADAGINE